MYKIAFFSLVSILLFFTACTSNQYIGLYVLVRHAEKADNSQDPSLTEKGEKRAELLAQMLSEVKIDQIYSTPYQRTRQTVEALAEKENLDIQIYDPAWGVEAFLDSLNRLPVPHNVVIAGHSNTIPAMLNFLLEAEKFDNLPDDDYSNLYLVQVFSKGPNLLTRLIFEPCE